MFAEYNLAFISKLLLDNLGYPDLLFQKARHGSKEGEPAFRGNGQVCFEEPFKFYEGLVVEGNEGNIIYTCSCLFKAVFNGLMREICIVLLPCKPLLLGCGYDLTVPNNAGG